MNISVIGLGKLGLCTAACFAAKGHRVVGVDNNPGHIAELHAGTCPIAESGLPELLDTAQANMIFTTDYAKAIHEAEVTLIIVPTPSNSDGAFSNVYLEAVLKELGPTLKEKDGFHIIDIVSTVMPGTCDRVFRPLLEGLTGKTCGKDFGLVYNPEFISLGSVIRDFLHPDMVLIGASDVYSGNTVRDLYASMVESSPQYAVMNLINAEIVKLSLNCFVTMKISFANELAALCGATPGADVDTVTAALGADSRIGPKYLKGGLGFGGPCFPRDNRALQHYAASKGLALRLSPAVTQVNDDVVDRLFATITKLVAQPGPVALLGLAYKPGTHIVEESPAIILAHRLAEVGYVLRLHDPLAVKLSSQELTELGKLCASPYQAVEGARIVALMTQWPEYASLDWSRLEHAAGPDPWLLDCWRVARGTLLHRFSYLALGLGATDSGGT